MAVRRATIAVHGVAVVASLSFRDVHVAVSAARSARAGFTRDQTNPARFGLTRARTAVPRRRVAVVASLPAGDTAVAADVEFSARFPSRSASITRVLTQAVRAASVARDDIAIVTHFARIEHPIAANIKGHARLTHVWAIVAGFDLAQAVAAVPGKGVAVVASLRGLID